MARTRAGDYDDKRRAILKAAAGLFAELGYDRASMAEVAKTCGVSKALVYHYYASKEALLFDMLEEHLVELVEAVAAADDPALGARARLEAMAVALLESYRDSDAEHQIQIAELGKTPREQQEPLKALERELVRRFAGALGAARPGLGPAKLLTPVTMSLFGMLNWHYLWHREGGPLGRADYARLAVALVLEGTGSLNTPP